MGCTALGDHVGTLNAEQLLGDTRSVWVVLQCLRTLGDHVGTLGAEQLLVDTCSVWVVMVIVNP